LRWWIQHGRKISLRVMVLVDAVLRDLFTGIGKPEPLKLKTGNVWSRRITREDRLVYRVVGNDVHFLQCRRQY